MAWKEYTGQKDSNSSLVRFRQSGGALSLSTDGSDNLHKVNDGAGAYSQSLDKEKNFEIQFPEPTKTEGGKTYYLNRVDLESGVLAAPGTCPSGDSHDIGTVTFQFAKTALSTKYTVGSVSYGSTTPISYGSIPKSETIGYDYTVAYLKASKNVSGTNHKGLMSATNLSFKFQYGCKVDVDTSVTGGTVTVSNSGIVEPDTALSITKVSPSSGYQFDRWSDGVTTGQRTVYADGKTTYTPIFKTIPYTITLNLAYKGNADNVDGSEALSTTSGWTAGTGKIYTREYNVTTSTITLPTVTKDYYTFMGWSTLSSSNPDSFSAITEVTNGSTGNKTYYAIYKPTGYTIEYNLHGGTNNPSNIGGYNIETETFTIGEPTKTGYVFDGWIENGQLLGKTITISKGSSGNRSLEAKFTVIPYTLQFDYQESTYGSTKPSNTASYTVDNAVVLNPPNAESKGWKFIGWTEQVISKETGQVLSTATINTTSTYTIPAGSIENRKYTARYEPIPYPITYVWDASLNNSINPEYGVNTTNLYTQYTTDKEWNLNTYKPTRAGYKFERYSSSVGGVEDCVIEKGSVGPRTYYLNFSSTTKKLESFAYVDNTKITTEIDYSIKIGFSKNKISQGETVNDIQYVDNISYDLSVTYNSNLFKFEGWKHNRTDSSFITKKDGTKLQEKDSIIVSPYDKENKYYAIFSYIDYTLNIDMRDISINTYPLGLYGKILAEGLRPGVEIKNIEGNSPKVTISPLHYNDAFTLSVIPYYNSEFNTRYHCSSWLEPGTNLPTGDSIIELRVDNSWSVNENRHLYFTQTGLENTVYDSMSDKNTLYYLLTKTITNFVVNHEIETLGDYGFLNCKELEYVYAPGVKIMGDRTCKGCDKLQTIIISTAQESGASIGLESLQDCPKLNLLIIPDGFMELNQLFNAEDNGTDSSKWSLFKRGLGEIYVSEKWYNEYTKESATNWPTYKNVIKRIDSNQKVYPY